MSGKRKIRKAKFVVPGLAVGFKTTTKRSKFNKDYQKYVKYKAFVQLLARASGMRLPLVATKDRPLMIRTVAYFKNGTHPDPENVHKGITDALFYREDKVKGKTGKGNDKYTGGSFPPPLYDKDNPRVIVIVKDYSPRKKVNE
jgi:isopentenyl diphosphate isomerase/L-lactate dehydrogenase-like FMN-dependent dehydrogenase